MSHQKKIILDILFETFHNNPASIGVVKQDRKMYNRFKLLLEYSYFVSEKQGKIYLSADETACCLTIDSRKKRLSLKQFYWYFTLIFRVIGIKRAQKILNRMKTLNAARPKEEHIYIWYIGVRKGNQREGKGSALLKEIILQNKGRTFCLETTKTNNQLFYEKLGFKKQKEIEGLGYPFTPYLLKR